MLYFMLFVFIPLCGLLAGATAVAFAYPRDFDNMMNAAVDAAKKSWKDSAPERERRELTRQRKIHERKIERLQHRRDRIQNELNAATQEKISQGLAILATYDRQGGRK